MKIKSVARKPAPARPGPASTEAQLIHYSRRIARLERERRELTRSLRAVGDELRVARRMLRTLAQQAGDRSPLSPPLRVFGESQG